MNMDRNHSGWDDNPTLSGSGRPPGKEEAGDVCASTRAGR